MKRAMHALGVVAALTLLSGCAYDYGYNGYAYNGYGYDGYYGGAYAGYGYPSYYGAYDYYGYPYYGYYGAPVVGLGLGFYDYGRFGGFRGARQKHRRAKRHIKGTWHCVHRHSRSFRTSAGRSLPDATPSHQRWPVHLPGGSA